MLNKLFGAGKLTCILQRRWQEPHKGGGARAVVEEFPSPLKIVHPGGVVEQYYMAVPAVRIMEAYPSFMVARPEVFRRPWDSVVHPDEILNPGEKFFIVPRRTVQKLRRRIRKPSGDLPSDPFASQSSRNAEACYSSDTSRNAEACYSSDTETQRRDHRMRFSGNGDEDGRKMTLSGSGQRMRRVRDVISWQPLLTTISE